ncbi:hypothetical protein J6590_030062 [Homalodisca vitripennis]|nr:hypothetical protein J6590_030062 [Homalodisca vitripennis]
MKKTTNIKETICCRPALFAYVTDGNILPPGRGRVFSASTGMSYSGYKSSSRGSRGFIRGGYRGSSRGGGGGEGGSWRGGGTRGGYISSSRGSGRGSRFSSGASKWDREASSGSYESRSRYNSGGDRYSSHGREDSSYRYRGDDSLSSYTSRDHSHRSSSPDRKRIRTEYVPASSMHRSHDYGDVNEYSSRSYGGYESKRISSYGGGDERRSLFREERERIRSDDYQFRKPISIGSPRHSTPRGMSYRGRTFSRGIRSGFRRPPMSYRGGPGGFLRKRSLMESYGIRKRIVTNKTQEYLRRLKMLRIQR